MWEVAAIYGGAVCGVEILAQAFLSAVLEIAYEHALIGRKTRAMAAFGPSRTQREQGYIDDHRPATPPSRCSPPVPAPRYNRALSKSRPCGESDELRFRRWVTSCQGPRRSQA